MKNILLVLIVIAFVGCEYDDDYLDPRLDTIAYFASADDYTRTLVVGEGLHFKIGAAMAGELSNDEDRTVDFKVYQNGIAFDEADDTRELMPTNFYNSDELSGIFQTIIPKGEFLGYFDVVMDSVAFLSDPLALDGTYTLPVKIVSSSLDSIAKDSVNVSVKYISGIDGYYLFESVIKKELNGNMLDDKMETEKYTNESDDSAWRLATIAPFQVQVSPATVSFSKGVKFNMTYQDGDISIQSIDGQPIVELEGDNSYDRSTRDFDINFKYQQASNDTIYHVNTQLKFRNRLRDGINETREYLNLLEN